MNNQNQVKEYNITNIYINDEDEQAGVEIFTLAKLNMTSEEMRQYYRDYYKYLIDNGYDEIYGARPLKRFVRKKVETLIAEKILTQEILPMSKIVIDSQNNNLILRK